MKKLKVTLEMEFKGFVTKVVEVKDDFDMSKVDTKGSFEKLFLDTLEQTELEMVDAADLDTANCEIFNIEEV